MVRNYYKAILDEQDVDPEKYRAEYKQIQEILKEVKPGSTDEMSQEAKEIYEKTPSTLYAVRFLSAKEICEQYPNGMWVDETLYRTFQNLIKNARNTLRQNKNKS